MLAPAFGFAQRWPQSLGAQTVGNWKRTGFMEVMHYAHNRAERVWWHLVEDGLAFPAEPGIVQPGLIFHGSADETVPVAFSETYAAKHPNVKLRIPRLTINSQIRWRRFGKRRRRFCFRLTRVRNRRPVNAGKRGDRVGPRCVRIHDMRDFHAPHLQRIGHQ